MGTARPEIRPNLWTFPVGNYLILYQQTGRDAKIIRGAQQWQDLLWETTAKALPRTALAATQ